MKAKILKQRGFELYIDKDGNERWVLPLCELSSAAGESISDAQMATIMENNLARGKKQLDLIRGKAAAPIA